MTRSSSSATDRMKLPSFSMHGEARGENSTGIRIDGSTAVAFLISGVAIFLIWKGTTKTGRNSTVVHGDQIHADRGAQVVTHGSSLMGNVSNTYETLPSKNALLAFFSGGVIGVAAWGVYKTLFPDVPAPSETPDSTVRPRQ